MSKNFELLQQVGLDEELFRTSELVLDKDSAEDSEANLELDKTARDKALLNASLPNVLETSDEATGPARAVAPAPNFSFDEESIRKSLQESFGTAEFRTPRNPTSLIGAAATPKPSRRNGEASKSIPRDIPQASPEEGSQELSWQANLRPASPSTETPQLQSEPQEAWPRASRKIEPPPAAIPERPPQTKKKARENGAQKGPSAPSWVNSVVEGAKGWKWNASPQSKAQKDDLDAMAREEDAKLVQRVFAGQEQSAPRVALFSGLESADGCASICARVAKILSARGEGSVCIVDAHFQSPSLHKYFGVENTKGLAEAALEFGPIWSFVQQTLETNLWLLPSGKSSALTSFPDMASGLRMRINELREAFRFVVINGSPMRAETNAMSIGRWTDGVVLVIEAHSTRRDTARRVKENLLAANVSLLGVVLNNRTFPIPEAIYRRL